MALIIEALQPRDLPLFKAHFARHVAESGDNNFHFMPFSPSDSDEPKGLDSASLNIPIGTQGWQRWFVAFNEARTVIVGHVDLKGDFLKTGLHRCELGIGIEAGYRDQGLGKRLLCKAIDLCRETESLDWLDLKVFRHNNNAIALYLSFGFSEVGTLVDRFRIDGVSVEDVIMTLSVTGPILNAQKKGNST